METDDTKGNQDKEENIDPTTNNVVPPAEEDQKLPNNNGPKTKTITMDLPVEEHVPCVIANEIQLVQFEVSSTVYGLKFYIFTGARRHMT